MSLTFWDTVRGMELADTLIRTLPKLTGRKQECISCNGWDEAITIIKSSVNKENKKFVAAVPENDPRLVILETTR